MTDEDYMRVAIMEAEVAILQGEVPVGAVLVDPKTGDIISSVSNAPILKCDPTAHAEILAIRDACQYLKTDRLEGCDLWVTLEPCTMCAGALVWSRLDRLVFGAFDAKAGAASTLYDIPQDARLNHQIETISGVEAEASADLLRAFFRARRGPVSGDGASGLPTL